MNERDLTEDLERCKQVVKKDRASVAALRCLLDHPQLSTPPPVREPPVARRSIRVTVTADAHVAILHSRKDCGPHLGELPGVFGELDFTVAMMVNHCPSVVARRRLSAGEWLEAEVPGEARVTAGDAGDVVWTREPWTGTLDPQGRARMRELRPGDWREVQVVDAAGRPVPGARVTGGRGIRVADDRGRVVQVPSGVAVWAVAEEGMSDPSEGATVVLSHPRQRCRFVDPGGAVVAETWVDELPWELEAVRDCWAELKRRDATTVDIHLLRTLHLRLPGILPLDKVDEAWLVQADGSRRPVTEYVLTGVVAGPARLELRIGADAWSARFEVGALATEVRPRFQRLPRAG